MSRSGAYTALLPVLLVACGPRLGVPKATFGTSGPIALQHTDADPDRWYVDVEIEGAGRRTFLFDTGQPHTRCDDSLLADLGLTASQTAPQHTPRGVRELPVVRLPPVTLGGHTLGKLVCHAGEVSGPMLPDPVSGPIAGVLGVDALWPFHVEIDPGRQTLKLGPLPDDVVRDRTRLQREDRATTRVLLTVQIGAQQLHPVVSTGSAMSMLDGVHLGLDPVEEVRLLHADPGARAVPVTVPVFDTDKLHVGGLPVGPIRFHGDPGTDAAGGILGLDVLNHFRQTWDIVQGTILLEPL